MVESLRSVLNEFAHPWDVLCFDYWHGFCICINIVFKRKILWSFFQVILSKKPFSKKVLGGMSFWLLVSHFQFFNLNYCPPKLLLRWVVLDAFLVSFLFTVALSETNCLSVFDHFVGLALKGINVNVMLEMR